MPKTSLLALAAAVLALSVSCGSAVSPSGQGGGTRSGQLEIYSAKWRDSPVPRAVVSGEWGLGISTPPSCSLIEGRGGGRISWYDPAVQVELDGRRFRQEFVRNPKAEDSPRLDPEAEYYVRCRSSGDTGKAAEALAPVRGRAPVS